MTQPEALCIDCKERRTRRRIPAGKHDAGEPLCMQCGYSDQRRTPPPSPRRQPTPQASRPAPDRAPSGDEPTTAPAERGEAGSDWPPFKDIAELVAVPKMTTDMLPRCLAPFAVDAAKSMDLPLEFFAVPMIVSASALLGHRVVALPRARGDWWQPGIVWGMVIGQPSIGKTPAEAKALHPFHEVMRAAEANHVGEGEPPRFKVCDATTEKIGEIMESITSGRALLQHCSELSGLFGAFAKRGREADRSWYLQIWDLRTALLQDRIGRGTTKARCGLALYGAIQPGVLGQYVKAAKDGGIGADGFLQRFGVAVYPDTPRTYHRSDHPPDLEALEAATSAFHRLANLDPGQLGAQPPMATVPFPGLRFTPEAQEAFDAWHDRLMVRLRRNDDGASEAFLAHLGKLAGLVPSLALIFHLLDHEGGPSAGIDRTALGRALAMVGYLEHHAAKIYAEGPRHVALALAEQIRDGTIAEGTPLRDVYRAQRSGLRTAAEAKAGATELEALGWLRLERAGRRGLGRVIRLRPNLAECLGDE